MAMVTLKTIDLGDGCNFLPLCLAEADIKQTNADSTSPSEKDVR